MTGGRPTKRPLMARRQRAAVPPSPPELHAVQALLRRPLAQKALREDRLELDEDVRR
jgi:hypothetical protein